MTGKQLAHPLAAVLASAKKKLPATTGATARYEARIHDNSGLVVVLADVSGSMGESAGTTSRYEVLKSALSSSLPSIPNAKLVAFGTTASPVNSIDDLPQPNGGTALHLAFRLIRDWRPAKTIVVHDGHPNDAALALSDAAQITGVIDVLYCGPDSDQEAIAFMNALARVGLGRPVRRPFSAGHAAISHEIKQLALPAR